MEFRILGPMEVTEHGQTVPLGGAKQRALLAVLLLHPNEVVSSDRLIDGVWAGEPPATALKTLQVYVSQLRKRLGTDVIVTRAPGYLLRVDLTDLDLSCFGALVKEARGAAPEASAAKLREALALWRGPPLAEFTYQPFAQAEIGRLEELHISALEERIEAELALGLHADLVGELEALAAQHPLRERLRGQLMLALYRSGRQAEALHAYQEGRRLLVDQLGIDPGAALHQLEKQILNQDPSLTLDKQAGTPHVPVAASAPRNEQRSVVVAREGEVGRRDRAESCPSCGKVLRGEFRFCPSCAAPLGETEREQRKTVTIVFCDVTGSTAMGESLDPEVLRALLARYFERMRGIVEAHGGEVEKFIGDAVMAVFGVPVAHEDDALRACRAAVEMRDALPELGLAARIGVNTGEVVTGTAERLVTGDAANVAARLEQATEPGTILIGEVTHDLVRTVVSTEPVNALTLKGKSEPVRAFRLLAVLGEPERRHSSIFVGRERELDAIAQAWARVGSDATCELLTVVGEPGVGKSRLVAEALASTGARVVRGRCVPYGDGITYWPVVEVIKQIGVLPSDPAAASALGSLLGETDEATSADQIGWAFRKLVEEHAPLIVCVDDIQWGEETFLDLLEATALLTTAPVMLLCMARSELLERRLTWPGVLRLEPLTGEEASALIRSEVEADVGDRIARAAGGNPLFITEMLAMARERTDVEVPATLRALLAARLDQLDDSERRVLERGSVEGELFHRGAVQALAPEEAQVTARLTGLVRRELLRPDRPQFAGEDAFRFRHLLIRDAAYDALPKSVRAELHERFAEWLEQNATLLELDEIVGYHLERATSYREELGRPAEDLAARAGERLAAAGRRALWREDRRAARALLERALILTRPWRLDVLLEVDLAATLFIENSRHAIEIVDAAAERALVEGNATGEAFARAMAGYHRFNVNECSAEKLDVLLLEALPLLEEESNHAALVHVWEVFAISVANARGLWGDATHASMRAIEHAKLAGQQRTGLFWIEFALALGPTPAEEALEQLDRLLPESPNPYSVATRAWLLAMLDRFDEALPLAYESNERQRELDGRLIGETRLAYIARMAGDHATATCHFENWCAWLEEREQHGLLATYVGELGQELCALGRFDEAAEKARLGRELADHDDLLSNQLWRLVQARVLAHRGEHEEAEGLARGAVAELARLDSPIYHGDAFCSLAEVMLLAGRTNEAAAAFRDALDRYERKGVIPLARQVRDRLAKLEASARPAST